MPCGSRRYDDTKEGFIAHAQKTAGIFAIVLLIWAVSGFGVFWPGWVLLFCGLKLGNHARRVYSGRLDDDSEADADDEREDVFA